MGDSLGASAKPEVTMEAEEIRRLSALRNCAMELNSRCGGDSDLRRVCQPARLWEVSAETRRVVADSATITFVHGICPQTVAFLAKRRQEASYACIELLDDSGKTQVRFLVQAAEVVPAIRGFYSIRARILTNIPSHPKGVIFNRGYFT